MQRKEGVLSKLCWVAISTYELESLASWALASSVGPDCVIIQERTDSWDGKVHRGDNRTNFAWNRNRNERGNRKRNQDHSRNQLQQRGCQWIFQPPKASHASGVDRGKAHPQYSYRLTAILGNSLVDEEAMATSLTEVESILNPRPVCAISDDSSDPESLTPKHLLLQRPVLALSTSTFVKEALCSRKKWRQMEMNFGEDWSNVTPQCCRNDRRGANFVGTLEWETSCSWWKNDFPAVSGIGAELRRLFRDETDCAESR